jgi:hypothetical protein
MRQDLLVEQVIDRRKGGVLTYQLESSRLTELQFVCTNSFHQADEVSIKLRPPGGGVVMIADRLPARMLGDFCDFKFGRPTRGTADTDPGDDNPEAANTNTSPKVMNLDAFKLPLGHITLKGGAQLEITIRLTKAFGGDETFKVYSIAGPMASDVIWLYDANNDLESTHYLVREIYVCSKGQQVGAPLGKYSFFDYAPQTGGGTKAVQKDVKVQITAEGETFLNDVDGMGSTTALVGNLTGPPNTFLYAYGDGDDLPTSEVKVKVSGADRNMAYLLVIREHRVAQMTIASNLDAAQKQIDRTKSLERTAPEQAAAARAADVTTTSANLVAEANKLPQNTAAA